MISFFARATMRRVLPLIAFVGFASASVLAHDEPHTAPGGHAEIGALSITGAYSRATAPSAPVGGGYLIITNNGDVDDKLIGVSAPVSTDAQIHEMSMDGDMMRMQELPDGLPIPAGETVKLEPGGYHLMFIGLTTPLVENETFPVTLRFEQAGEIVVDVEITSPAGRSGHSAAGGETPCHEAADSGTHHH